MNVLTDNIIFMFITIANISDLCLKIRVVWGVGF